MFNVLEFAAYVMDRHKEKFNKDITPVRLQKSLYFCFAFWGGFVRKSAFQEEGKTEISFIGLDEKLFDAEFEAWAYGPVIPEVYYGENILENNFNEELFLGKEEVKEFVDDVLNDIDEVTDFRLVDISHKDRAWMNNFDYNSEFHNNPISHEEIIREYARR